MPAKFIDLSQELSNETPVFPGDQKIEIKQEFTVKKDGFSLHSYSFSGHCSSHIDAPAHFIEDGKNLSQLPLDNFCGEGIVIPVENKDVIDIDILNNVSIKNSQIVLFYTGWAEKINSPKYFLNHPILNEKLAGRLSDLKVKMVGIDAPSPDKEPYPVHKILLSHGILILENLTNLDKLTNNFKIY